MKVIKKHDGRLDAWTVICGGCLAVLEVEQQDIVPIGCPPQKKGEVSCQFRGVQYRCPVCNAWQHISIAVSVRDKVIAKAASKPKKGSGLDLAKQINC